MIRCDKVLQGVTDVPCAGRDHGGSVADDSRTIFCTLLAAWDHATSQETGDEAADAVEAGQQAVKLDHMSPEAQHRSLQLQHCAPMYMLACIMCEKATDNSEAK